MRFAILYLVIGIVTAIAYSIFDAIFEEDNPSHNASHIGVMALAVIMWFLIIPSMIHDFLSAIRKRRRRMRDAAPEKRVTGQIYDRYVELCQLHDVKVKPRSSDWFDHYELILMLDEVKK